MIREMSKRSSKALKALTPNQKALYWCLRSGNDGKTLEQLEDISGIPISSLYRATQKPNDFFGMGEEYPNFDKVYLK